MPSWTLWALLGLLLWVLFLLVVLRVLALTGRSARETAPARRRQPVEPLDVQERDRPFATAEGRRILVVDDDPGLRVLLRTTLAADEFVVHEAGTAEEAADLARFWSPSIVILDIGLPGMDGLTFCRKLKQDAAYGAPLVVLLTGAETTGRKSDLPAPMPCCASLSVLSS